MRDAPYDLDAAEIGRRTSEAWQRGATEVCLQGGIRPGYTGETYLGIVAAVKAAAPDMHVHAFSPLEIWHGAGTLGLPLEDYLARLKAAGLASLPGTAAEILDDEVRAILCPDKITTEQWFEVMEAAHGVGLKSTATIMFGHVDGYRHWARHLLRVRELQAETGGFTEFVPLPFVHMEAPIYLKGQARKGPTLREAVLMHAVARLALDPLIPNIQASWVKMGPEGAARLPGGGLQRPRRRADERVHHPGGRRHARPGDGAAELEAMIREAGRKPRQRTTLYQAGCRARRVQGGQGAHATRPPPAAASNEAGLRNLCHVALRLSASGSRDERRSAPASLRAARSAGVRLPTFAELADPGAPRPARKRACRRRSGRCPHPANLCRVNWFNDLATARAPAVPAFVELPPRLTGVKARIVVALGALFPMIRAHKVLAAYACLAPRLVSGRFDPTQAARGVAVDRQLLPRRRRHLAHPGLPRRRRAAGGDEPGALRLAGRLGRARPRTSCARPAPRSNVKEIYDKCAELARDPANEIVNQFSEFGNYLVHWRCTGPALERDFRGPARGDRRT